MFPSCEKSELLPMGGKSVSTPSNPSLNALLNSHQKIIFQVGELNENNKMEKGWLMTNDGDIHTYQLEPDQAWSPELPSLSYLELKMLKRSKVDQIGTVSIEKLLSNYEKIDLAAQNNTILETENENHTDKPYVAYIAYKINPEVGLSCDARDSRTDYYHQIILSIERNTIKFNPEVAATEILAWLKEIEQELSFNN